MFGLIQVLLMMHAASSMNVKDVRTGRLLLCMRFSGLPAALDYLSGAKLVCSACGKQFSGSSTITMMNRGDSWELMLPHNCEPPPALTESAWSGTAPRP